MVDLTREWESHRAKADCKKIPRCADLLECGSHCVLTAWTQTWRLQGKGPSTQETHQNLRLFAYYHPLPTCAEQGMLYPNGAREGSMSLLSFVLLVPNPAFHYVALDAPELTIETRVAFNSQAFIFACLWLCLLSAGVKGVGHHIPLMKFYYMNECR